MPDRFEIGRRTFFDFGPPFNYYEIFLVRPMQGGSLVEKIMLAEGGSCIAPGKLEVSSATLKEPVASLLDENPCAIPEKELHWELKRCKHCQTYSGADVAMQVQCEGHIRTIRSAVLEKDWFEEHPGTPKHTSRIMELLARLQQATGPGPLDQPIFQTTQPAGTGVPHSPALDELAAGKYDALFENAPSKPSEIYRAIQKTTVMESIQLVSSVPLPPEIYTEPIYPQMARIAHIEGTVVLALVAGPNGEVTNLSCLEGAPILCASAKDAASKWRFGAGSSDREIKATLKFTSQCREQK
jgi:TonB family protein